MQRLVIGCIFLFASVCAFGQTAYMDSLRLALATSPEDTSRVRALNALSESMSDYETGEALTLAKEAYDLAVKLDDTVGQGIAKRHQCNIYHDISADGRAMNAGLASIELLRKAGAPLELARMYLAMGILHSDMQNITSAVEYYGRAEKLYLSIDRPRGARLARHNMAVVHSAQGAYDKALQQYRTNLATEHDTSKSYFKAATINNMGSVYISKGEMDSASYYLKWAIDLKREIPDQSARANSYNNFGEVALKQGNFQLAEVYLDSANTLAIASNDLNRIMDVNENLALLHEKTGQYQTAIKELQAVLKLRDSLFNFERSEQLTQLSAVFDANLRKEEIAELNKEKAVEAAGNTRFRWIALGLAAVLALFIGLLVVAIRRSRERTRSNNELLRKNQEIERQKQEILVQNEVLSQQNQTLADLNREKDGLIGIVAHDIRAPLNRSAALAELVASVGPLNAEQKKFLDLITKVTDDGARLIQDLLELNAYERKDARIYFRKTSIHELVQVSVHGFQVTADAKNIKINLDLQPEAEFLVTDGKLLTRILDNLLSNAIKFSHRNKEICVQVRQQNRQMYLSVRDQGQGMSAEDQEKMFRKFQRLSARPTGGETSTGLGLSIIKTLVDRLQGRIRVESEEGKGTEFRLSFPLRPKGAPKSANIDALSTRDS